MVDTGALFEKARLQVDAAVESAGCTVRISRETVGVDATLAKTTTRTGERTVPALVVLAGDQSGDLTDTLTVRSADLRVILRSSETLPDPGETLEVLTALHKDLVGVKGEVLGSLVDVSGAYTATYVRPGPNVGA